MSAILSLFGVGDKNKNTDRSYQLQGWGDLTNLINGAQGAGSAATGDALSHFTKLLSGNRQAVESAVAPTTNAVASQGAAAGRQAAATGTSRGGGTNAQDQQTADKVSSATQGAINQAVPGAASELGSLGTTLLGQAGPNASNLASQAGGTRQNDISNSNNEMNGALTQLAGLLMGV
jgi:hypothetical protein